MRCKRASVEKPKTGGPKPLATIQPDSGVVLAIKSSVPAAASIGTFLPLTQYRRKTMLVG